MRFPAPRIVVVDDDLADAQAIQQGMGVLGTSALALHYPFAPEEPSPSLHSLRLLFLDLHLLPGAPDSEQQIKNAVGVLEQILAKQVSGPYVIVLWSKHADELDQFQQAVSSRLPGSELPLPLHTLALSKVEHMENVPPGAGGDGPQRRLRDPQVLGDAIKTQLETKIQLAALLAWEEQVAIAAAQTLHQILRVAQGSTDDPSAIPARLGEVLRRLAEEAVGAKNTHGSEFRATNEVLAAVLIDRLLHGGADEELRATWSRALSTSAELAAPVDGDGLASLNTSLHLDLSQDISVSRSARGNALALTGCTPRRFRSLWGVTRDGAMDLFSLQGDRGSNELLMIQVQAACDHAQRNPGLLPYVLGVRCRNPDKSWSAKLKGKQHTWLSPVCCDDTGSFQLAVSFRYKCGLDRELIDRVGFPVLLRLRESLLADLCHRLHSHQSRPGFIGFDLESASSKRK